MTAVYWLLIKAGRFLHVEQRVSSVVLVALSCLSIGFIFNRSFIVFRCSCCAQNGLIVQRLPIQFDCGMLVSVKSVDGVTRHLNLPEELSVSALEELLEKEVRQAHLVVRHPSGVDSCRTTARFM